MQQNDESKQSFEEAAEQGEVGIIGEFVGFMRDNAKWWLIPFLLVFGILAIAIIAGGSGIAPFIYTLF